MQNIRAYLDSTLVVESFQPNRASRAKQSVEHIRAKFLVGLLVLVNILAGGAFLVAAAFASEFVLMTTFWEGACLGAIVYALLNIGIPGVEDC